MSRFLNRFTKTTLAAVTALSLGFADVHAEGKKNDSGNADQSGKDETVYVITDESGSRQEVIVSDWLKNTNGSMTLKDESLLSDIENVAGNESFTKNTDGTITWNAGGNDIYYQGTTDKELPVEVKISYKLDGRDITAEELAGKKGHVIIHFDYINHTEDTVTVNGKEETVKVPFAMITGVQINQEKFSDIKVTNGKVISEGKTSFVVGMAFPGLSDCLDTGSDLLEADIPEYVEIEADTTGFELGMTMTVAGNNLLKNLDLNTDGQVSELTDKMNQLIDASKQLEDGTKALKDGTAELRDGAGQLVDGTNTLKDGTSQLKDGASALKDGAGKLDDGVSAVKDGAEKLNAGAQTLKAGADSASAGASDLSKGAATLAEGAKTLDAGMTRLQTGASELKAGTAKLKAGTENLYGGLYQEAEGLKTLKTSVDAAVNNAQKTKETAEGAAAGDAAAVEQAKANLISAVNALVEQKAKEAYAKGLQDGTDGELLNQFRQRITSLQEESAAKDNEIADLKAEIEQLKNASAQTPAAPVQEAPVQTAPAAAKAPAAPLEAAPQEETPVIPESVPAGEEAVTREEPQAAETPAVIEDTPAEEPTQTAAVINADEAGMHIVMLGTEEPSNEETELAAAVGAFAETVKNAAIHGTTAEVLGQSIESLGLLQGGVNKLYAGMYGVPQQSGILDGARSLETGADQLDAGMAELTGTDENGNPVGGIAALKAGADQLSAGMEALAQGSAKLDNGNKALAEGTKTLANGTSELSDGTKELSNGSGQLKDGASDLAEGAVKLDNGAGELRDGVVKLADGTVALDDGALELMEGMSQFETEGMEKLADVFGNKLTDMIDRLTALNDAGTSYKNFAGASGSENDSVKFIFKTESVKAE
ncbi:MAG: hypothetical protein IKE28_03780 [Solobacterium sp.]|nr:hypothetical protein [Solobacterium sp.]